MKINWKSNKQGFTGIQIIIVIILIGIIVGVSYVAINSNREKGKVNKEETTIQNKDIKRENTEIGIGTDNKEEEKKIAIANQIVDNIQPIKRAIRLPSYKSVVKPSIGIPPIPNTPNTIITPPTPIIPIIPPTPPLPPVVLGAGERDTTFDTGFDTGFPIGFNSDVRDLVLQSDDKILIGGEFTSYQGETANYIIRLNSDGSRDTTFDMEIGLNDPVFALALQSDGKILVGGRFTEYNGETANRIIRLNSDGSRDTSFDTGTGFNSYLLTLTQQADGKILVGGYFDQYNGEVANYIIRLNSDGSRDTTFDTGTGFNDGVATLTQQADGKILVGGYFTQYNGETANRIIRLNSDGSRDTTFDTGTGFSGSVYTIALQSDGKIVVGGGFEMYNEFESDRIIRLNSNGSRDTTFNVGIGFKSNESGEVYWVNYALIQNDGKILVGGVFTSYQGINYNRVVRLNINGSIDTTFNVDLGFNSTVHKLLINSDGKILAGGAFNTYQKSAANFIALVNSDGSKSNAFNIGNGFNDSVNVVDIQLDGKILVAGRFTEYRGKQSNKIIRLNSDGSLDISFEVGAGFNGDINTISIQNNGKILVGGLFTNYDDEEVNKIIRLNSDGSRDTTFDIGTGFDDDINTISIQNDGKILVGGWFNQYNSEVANNIIRLNKDGSRDESFNVNSSDSIVVYTIAIQNDNNILLGGYFFDYEGVPANNIVRLNSDGSRDYSFNIEEGFNPYGPVSSIKIQSDGKILVGGNFNEYNGEIASRIIRLNSDGSRDYTFGVGIGFNGDVDTLSLQSDGKILVGGGFTEYNNEGANRIMRMNGDGSIDTTFNIGSGFDSYVNNIKIQDNGKILVSGSFTSYQNQRAGYLVRLGN